MEQHGSLRNNENRAKLSDRDILTIMMVRPLKKMIGRIVVKHRTYADMGIVSRVGGGSGILSCRRGVLEFTFIC